MPASGPPGTVRGMKKMLLLVGAAALLAACSPSFNGGQTSKSLTLNQVTDFTSSYTTAQTYVDSSTGRVIPAGSDIICDNANTDLQFNFTWTGPLYQAGVRLKGLKTGAVTSTILSNATPGGDTSGVGSGTVRVAPGVAPQSVSFGGMKAQAIVPTPIPTANLNVKGYSYLQVVATDTSGLNSNIIESPTEIPVADCSF